MGEKTKNSFDLQSVVKSGARLSLIFAVMVICTSALVSYLLIATGEPEKYYDALVVAILVMSAFFTVTIFLKRHSFAIFDVIAFSLIVLAVMVLINLIFDRSSSGLKYILLKYLLVLSSGVLGVVISSGQKKKKKAPKRR